MLLNRKQREILSNFYNDVAKGCLLGAIGNQVFGFQFEFLMAKLINGFLLCCMSLFFLQLSLKYTKEVL